MVKIYEIIDCNGLRYVGSTIQTLAQRLWVHKADKKRGKGCMSIKLDLDNSVINLLEECDVSVRKERERHYINTLECVNQRRLNGKDLEKSRVYCRDRQRYVRSWGGDLYCNNNLLCIDVNLFI